MTVRSKRISTVLDTVRRYPYVTLPELATLTDLTYKEVKTVIHGLRKFKHVNSIRTHEHAKYIISNKGLLRLEQSPLRREEAEEEVIPPRTWDVSEVIARVPNSVFQMGERLCAN